MWRRFGAPSPGEARVGADIVREFRTYYTLTQLEKLLPPELFLRVHDSAIVNVEAVEELLYLGSHSYAVRLIGDIQVPVSRARFSALQEKLGVA